MTQFLDEVKRMDELNKTATSYAKEFIRIYEQYLTDRGMFTDEIILHVTKCAFVAGYHYGQNTKK